MSKKTIRIATRSSLLALWQANDVRKKLLEHWPDLKIELLELTTSGDKFLADRLLAIGNKGLFVKELEEALLDKRADLAVHSMKDVLADFPEGLSLSTICKRHNPLDAFVSDQYACLDELPSGAIVGTSSLRRQFQVLSLRPDISVKPLRGNIHSRIKKMQSGAYDGIILAAAGLERMGMHAKIRQTFRHELMLPACGQGAMGIECRTDDEEIQALIAPLNDPLSALCVHTERHVNAQLGGNCHTPLAVYCQPEEGMKLFLQAKVASPDGKTVIYNRQQGHQPEAVTLAENCAKALRDDGAIDLLDLSYE